MASLSVLIFSRNDVDKALDLVGDVYDIANEIVVVDSSNAVKHSFFVEQKRKHRLSKLKIFYTIALGYPDPLRMYALAKCSGDWVLLIDTDERLSKTLKSDIKNLIKDKEYAAFDMKRYEGVRKNAPLPSIFTWQIRLFRRGKAVFNGTLHEHPRIYGAVKRLPEEYYLTHEAELMRPIFEIKGYAEIRRYDYYLARRSFLLKVIGEDTVLAHRQGGLGVAAKIFAGNRKLWASKLKEWDAERSKSDIGVAKAIRKFGVTKYLGLDQEKTIVYLNKKYKNKSQGIQLLIQLLKNKYEHKAL